MAHVGLLKLVASGVLLCCAAYVASAQEAAITGSRPSAKAEEDGGARPLVFDEVVSCPGLALEWLAKRQRADGSWIACREHADGKEEPMDASATHATGLALLSLLGNGETHLKGEHQQSVRAGLEYLKQNMKAEKGRGDLRGGQGMKAHGVATLALCEAYGMTEDQSLRKPAQMAIAFIEHAQDRATGGWGPQPKAKDDMYVFGWQLLALRSAHLASLDVSRETVRRLGPYLDQRQTGGGRFYGRRAAGKDPRATAIGLLGRLALGWDSAGDRGRDGAEFLVKNGPARHDAEYNFFAQLLLFRLRIEPWSKWNTALRSLILERQTRDGSLKGTWFDKDDVQAKIDGRIGQTALHLMALEVYYRHLPVYRCLVRETADDNFGR